LTPLSRNRNWGHPELIQFIEQLSEKAARSGWRGLLIGDMSQPRGGLLISRILEIGRPPTKRYEHASERKKTGGP
jgi:hypothetical protein